MTKLIRAVTYPINPQMAQANARAIAIRRLQDAHPDEWEKLYGDAREQHGLPRDPSPSSLKRENLVLRRRIAEMQDARLAADTEPPEDQETP